MLYSEKYRYSEFFILVFKIIFFVDVDVEGSNLILTAKHSLINSAQQLPAEVSQVRPHTVVHVRNWAFL